MSFVILVTAKGPAARIISTTISVGPAALLLFIELIPLQTISSVINLAGPETSSCSGKDSDSKGTQC